MGSKKEEAERVVFGVSDEKEALKSWGVKEKQRERVGVSKEGYTL